MSAMLARDVAPPDAARDTHATPELSIVLPCLDEAETLAACVAKALDALRRDGISGEVIVADNGSTDGSQEIARSLGARVIDVPVRGYGAALRWGIDAARGRYVIMADADDSYDLAGIRPFVERLRAGDELVMGNRFRGGIKPGAMPRLHRYLGNPVLSGIGRLFFETPARDFHCGMRGFRKDLAERLDLQTTGMEFASEMVVKASIARMRVSEVPTTLSPDGRSRPPHLRSWHDGWRHLRFLLLYSPRFLFLFPGAALALVGMMGTIALLGGARHIRGVTFDLSSLLFSAAAVVLGVQAVLFWAFSKAFAINEGLLPPDPRLDFVRRYVRLETGLIAGLSLLGIGLALGVYATYAWGRRGFGVLDVEHALRLAIPATLFLILGGETLMSSFFLSLLGLKVHDAPTVSSTPGARGGTLTTEMQPTTAHT